jgi:hypothetical protein
LWFPNNINIEEEIGLIAVMRSAAQLDVEGIGAATVRKWHNVMELQEGTFVTSSVRADKGTASSIPAPHFSTHRSGNVPRARCTCDRLS